MDSIRASFFGKALKKNSDTTWQNGRWLIDKKAKGVRGFLTLG